MDDQRPDQAPRQQEGRRQDSAAQPVARARGEDYNTPLIVIYGMLFALIVFVGIVALNALFHQMQSAELARKSAAPPQELLDIRSAQQQELVGYTWVDAKQGVVGIPIELAMQLTAAELAAQQQTAAATAVPAAADASAGVQPQPKPLQNRAPPPK
jgi:hypothetical protein